MRAIIATTPDNQMEYRVLFYIKGIPITQQCTYKKRLNKSLT